MSLLPGNNPNPVADRPVRRSLRLSLMAWFMAVALVPLVAMGTVGFIKARDARRTETRQHLAALAANESAGLTEFLARGVRELDYQSRLTANLDFLDRLSSDLAGSGMSPRVWTRSSHWHNLTSNAGREITRFRNNSPWYDILLLNADGVVLFSCRQEDDLGTRLMTGPYSRSNLAMAVRRADQRQELVISPFASYAPGGGLVSAFLVVPVNGADGQRLGAMAFRVESSELAHVTGARKILDEETAVYLVDTELRLITRPRDGSALTVMKDQVHTAVTTAWLDRLGSSSAGDLQDYLDPLGRKVMGTCTTIDFGGQKLGLVTEIPLDRALAGLFRIRLAMLIMVIFTALMVVLAGQVISHRVVGPLVALGRIMKLVTDGHEVKDLTVSGHNEVGDLADQFATMIVHLNAAEESRDSQFRLQRSQFELNERMRGEPDTTVLSAAILEYIGDYYGAQVGAFYLARPGGLLTLAASVGQEGADGPAAELREGQGVVGRAALRRRIEVLHDIPADHVRICTAMGCSAPRTLIVAPFHLAGRVKGVMELGTVRDITDADLEFLRRSAESVALALDSCRSRERVHRLLGETRRQASALAHQQRELRESNERLARSDRYKSEFLANMSHELRTPLNSMMLMSQVLSENRRGVLNADEIEAATTIHQAGEDLLTIIDDILDMSKVEAGKLELSPEEVDVSGLVTSLRQLFQPVADGKNLALRTHIGPGVPDAFLTDGLRLKQILKNLLNNACKFTDSGSVVLRVRMPAASEVGSALSCRSGDCLALSVADTGIGMSPEVLDRIFEPFNQGDGSIGRRFGGSGLGLAISRRLAELLQGDLVVDSVAGKGTKFTLYLPLAAAPEVGGSVVAPVSAASGEPDVVRLCEPCLSPDVDFMSGHRLILADDEMRTLYRLSDELNALGLDTRTVRTVPELLRLSGDLPPQTIILVNPWCGRRGPEGPSGDSLLRRLRGACKGTDVPLVALAPVDCDEELSAADAVVAKPADVTRVLAACRQVLAPQEVPT